MPSKMEKMVKYLLKNVNQQKITELINSVLSIKKIKKYEIKKIGVRPGEKN